MFARPIVLALAIAGGIGLTGCATTRSELQLPGPGAAAAGASAGLPPLTGKTVLIRTVSDERVFEDAPSDPSTPSLGFGGSSKAPAEVKARAFARKRGGFGQAFGDVLLQPGQTVESVVRDNLVLALRQAGIQAATAAAAAPSGSPVIDVHVKAFWSWMNPGFWALTANGRIVTELEVAGRGGRTAVSVEHKESRQLMTESAWLETMTTTLELWRAETAKAATKLFAAP